MTPYLVYYSSNKIRKMQNEHECHLSGLFVVKPNKTVLTAKASTLLGLLFVPNILTMSLFTSFTITMFIVTVVIK